MVFTTAGGGANQLDTGYNIDNSLRFNDGDSPSLQFTPSSDSNEQTWTVSFWVKRGVIGTSSSQMIFMTDTNLSEYIFARFCGTEVTGKEDMFQVFMVEPNAREGDVRTARLFRDVSAWYHIVVRCDLTQSTAANRLRIYVNGVEETSFDTASYLNQNDDNINWNSNVKHAIGHQVQSATTERFLDGYLAEFYNIDGQSLGPDSFGETNDNGVWIPKKYTGSYGTNGFFLEFKQTGTGTDASGMGADTSGNDHHWTPANLAATDVTTDTPTNNFATLNSVAPVGSYAEGNLRYTTSTTDGEWSTSTISISTNAKWYCEVKAISKTAGAGIYYQVGVTKGNASDFTYRALYRSDGAIYVGGSNTATFSSYTDNDIISIAYDSSNRNVTFYKNGNSEGTVTAPSLPSTSDDYFFGASSLSSGNTFITEWNFGNPSFSISSGNADANGYGNFEYAVPSGYYALCTKNLAEYG